MAKHLILFVHGMGEHADGWHQDAADLLETNYNAIPAFRASTPWANRYVIKGIVYNDIFEALRTQWTAMHESLTAGMKAAGYTKGPFTFLERIAGLPLGKTFVHTHLLDVVLYRFFDAVALEVRAQVKAKILHALEAHIADHGTGSFSIIAHSLGTSVVHDALHDLYRIKHRIKGSDGITRFEDLTEVMPVHMIAMVANVSRVLSREGVNTFEEVYDSLVAPGQPGWSGVAARYYLDIAHEWDPFPQVKKFGPPPADWPHPEIRSDSAHLYQAIYPTAIKQLNVHDLQHYLNDPFVHARIFAALRGRPVKKFAGVEDRMVDYLTSPGAMAEDLAKESLQKWQLDKFRKTVGDDFDTWEEIFKSWAGILKIN